MGEGGDIAKRHRGRSIRPKHAAIVRVAGLLPMKYSLRELSTALEIPIATLNDWRELGMPFERDGRGHVWVSGLSFASWLTQARQQHRQKLKPHEVYCVSCSRVVEAVQQRIEERNDVLRLTGSCPICHHTVTRIVRRRK